MKKNLNRILIYSLIIVFLAYWIYYLFYKWSFSDPYINWTDNLPKMDLSNYPEESKEDKFLWDENIEFTHCESLVNYKDEKRIDFFEKEDVKLLTEKIRDYESERNDLLPYGRFPWLISEYCKTQDWNKFLFSAEAKVPTTLWIYDKELDLIEPTKLNNFVFRGLWKYIPYRNYWDISLEKYLKDYWQTKSSLNWFWKRNWNIIEYRNYAVPLIWQAESAPWYFSDKREFFSKSTVDYCDWGLTPAWKLSVCFADVFYEFDFVKNILTESRVCSYYIDDNWNIKTLEKCFDLNIEHKWYKLKSKSKWVDFYQNENWDLSILEVDLNESNISFDWANTFYHKESTRVSEWFTDQDWVIQIPPSYDVKIEKKLEYEYENNKLDRFIRYYADEFIKMYDYKISDKEVIAFVNGQFFNQNKAETSLSFPIISNWKIINSYVDNDLPKRTFVIDKNKNAKIISWYNPSDLEKYEELIVSFSPEVNARPNEKIGRTYIWLLDNKKVVFFIAKNKTQEEMDKIISDYWIEEKNIIMMDWWPSSQFAYYENKWPWSEFERLYWKWPVPHFFVIFRN